jgi:hypothetical protein
VTVSNTNDVVNGATSSLAALIASNGGDGISLREAVLAANADTTNASDTIDFAVTGTIPLTNAGHAGEIAIDSNVRINGPGASLLSIQAFSGTAAAGALRRACPWPDALRMHRSQEGLCYVDILSPP